jgi:hypothetical protein
MPLETIQVSGCASPCGDVVEQVADQLALVGAVLLAQSCQHALEGHAVGCTSEGVLDFDLDVFDGLPLLDPSCDGTDPFDFSATYVQVVLGQDQLVQCYPGHQAETSSAVAMED